MYKLHCKGNVYPVDRTLIEFLCYCNQIPFIGNGIINIDEVWANTKFSKFKYNLVSPDSKNILEKCFMFKSINIFWSS